jgi:hypothetical protein
MQQITYLFKCSNGHIFDTKGSMDNPPQESICPVCGEVGKRVYEINVKKHGVQK